MIRFGHIAQGSATLLFVASSLAYAVQSRPTSLLTVVQDRNDPLLLTMPHDSPAVTTQILPQLYMSPENPLMWALLIVLWAVLIFDAVEQFHESSDDFSLSAVASGRVVWPLLSLALVAGAIWPWMVNRNGVPVVLGALFMGLATVIAAKRARNKGRPAIGFLAGYSTAICIAAVAALLAERLTLSLSQTATLAILPGALIGLAAQGRIGQSIAYPMALIWAFCGLAVTTMGTSPMIAIAAIVGISAMAIVLIDAAS